MRNPFRRKAITSTPAVLEAIRDGSFQPYPLLGGGARQRIQEAFTFAHSASLPWIYQNTPAVRTVIDTLTRNISQLDLRLYEEIDEANREPKPDHPAAMSMRYPSETVPADQFIRQLFQDFFVFDDAFALMGAAGNGRVSFNWMPAQMVQVLGNGLFTATGYRFWRQDGTFVDFAPEQVLHWHGENPFDPRVGISKLDTLRAVIAEDASLQQAIVELANAGMTEPIWVSRPLEAPPWSNEARKGFEEDMTNRLRRRNTTPPVIEEGMEMHSFGVSPKDAQMFEVRKWAIERVAAAYGVPLGMVGLADNLEQAQSQFYSDTLPPYLEAFTRMLNLRLLVREYNWTDGCFEFNLDEKHMGDDRLQALTAASGRPVLLTNEARAKLNLPPVDIGDELVTPLNVIVGENPKPTPTTMPVQDPNKPPQDGSYRSDQGSAVVPPKALKATTNGVLLPQLHPGRRDDLDRQFAAINRFESVMETYYKRLERSVAQKTAKRSRWGNELMTDLLPVLQSVVEREGALYAFKLAGTFDPGLTVNYLKAMAESAAFAIVDVILGEIEAGGVEHALAKQAVHVEGSARGLGTSATRFARLEAARQAPNPQSRVKTWIADTERHAEFDGDTVHVDADWPAGFAPGGAPNCACTMAIT